MRLYIFYPDGTIVQVNQTLLKWLNYQKEDVIFIKKFHDIMNGGGRLYFQMYVFPLLNMQESVNEISIDLLSSDKIKISCLFNASVSRRENGTILLIRASLFNITDRKKYEVEILKAKTQAEDEKKRFEFLANTLPSMLWTALPSGKIDFQNDRFFEYFNQVVYETNISFLKSVVFPDDFHPTIVSWIKAKKEDRDVEWELRLKNRYGQYKWFSVRIIACKDAENKVWMWLGSCTDIHTQKELQINALKDLTLELSEASSNAEHKAKILKEVAFAQSHLVRSPVSKILGLISLLKDRDIDDESKLIVSLLTQSVDQLDSIISEIVKKTHNNQPSFPY